MFWDVSDRMRWPMGSSNVLHDEQGLQETDLIVCLKSNFRPTKFIPYCLRESSLGADACTYMDGNGVITSQCEAGPATRSIESDSSS
jgi:hypothetical protein